jgi:hypothetical protein
MYKTDVPRRRSAMSPVSLFLHVTSPVVRGVKGCKIFTKLISDSLVLPYGPQCENTYKSF